jgi:hypothetical protein
MDMRVLLVLLVFVLFAVAQQAPPDPQSVKIIGAAMKPPPVTLPQALQIAEKYIADKKIRIERYWLMQVKWGLPSGVKPVDFWGGSRWFFWWVNLNGAMGDYVEIEVDMNGHALRRPSM